MSGVILTSQLTRDGFRPGEIARLARRGELVHLRRGAWTNSDGPEAISVDQAAKHRLLIAATVDQISADAVLSHSSAAVPHGLPVWTPDLSTVHWTRTRPGGGRVRAQIHVYAAPLEPDEIVLIDGQPVTSLERTVIDVARHLPFEQGVMTADAALHSGLDTLLLAGSGRRAVRRPGGAGARRVVAFVDGRSESPGESWSRVEFARMGKPPDPPNIPKTCILY